MTSISEKYRPLYLPAAIVLLLIAGCASLRRPFAGDQALFWVGGLAMHHGALLYRDFWDLKQPGIFTFFWLAQLLPTSAEVAVHALEVGWFLAFGIALGWTLRRKFLEPAYAAVAVLLVCVLYFIICGNAQLTQVEGLVAFPLYVCAWWLLGSSGPLRNSRAFAAGVAAGLVLLLKLMLVLLPIGFLLMLIVQQRNRPLLPLLMAIFLFGLGTFIALLPLAWFYADHWLLLYDTFIEQPMRITRELPHTPLSVLRNGLMWFVKSMGLLIPLALAGAVHRRRDWLAWGMIAWIVLGAAVIVLQRKGWDYHYLLLLCPIGILATFGCEAIALAAARRHQPWLVWAAVLLLLPYLVLLAARVVVARHDPRSAFYEPMAANAAILQSPAAAPGPIYVLGNPLIYYLSGRPQAVAINGWSPEWLLEDQWQQLVRDLRLKRPAYIFVDQDNDEPIAARGQLLTQLLHERYQQIAGSRMWAAR